MSEASPLAALDLALNQLLANVAPDARAALAVRMGRALRRSQVQRIADQRNPDGSPFAPRKPREGARARRGRIRRRAQAGPMFRKLRLARWLQLQTSADEVQIGFSGAAARIARVHQLGLRDRVSRDPGAPEVTYAERVVIGFRQEEIDFLLGMAAEAVAAG